MWFRDPTADTRFGNTYGQDKTVPEFQDPEPHDTFKVDIYQIGNVINELLEVCGSFHSFKIELHIYFLRSEDI